LVLLAKVIQLIQIFR